MASVRAGRRPILQPARPPSPFLQAPRASAALDTAQALAFIGEKIALARVGGRGQVGLIQRYGGAMKEHLAPDAAQARSNNAIDRHRIGPGRWLLVAQATP